MPKLVQKIVCGFGNQLFFIFNALSLSIDYGLELEIELKSTETSRPNITKYIIFNNDKIKKKSGISINGCEKIKQKNFWYDKIELKPNTNYLIDGGRDGYFQSYKFFWHNRDKIKEYLNIPNEKFTKFQKIIKDLGKKTIAVHIRLTDYVKYKNFFYNYPISYYREVLTKYNLDEYEIILFSDDSVQAYKMLSNVVPREKIILADKYSKDDEDQFALMCYTDVRVLVNSSYSLWTCYLNEIYNFNPDSKYWFGNIWFGPAGPKYKIEDIVPINNPNFNIVNVQK